MSRREPSKQTASRRRRARQMAKKRDMTDNGDRVKTTTPLSELLSIRRASSALYQAAYEAGVALIDSPEADADLWQAMDEADNAYTSADLPSRISELAERVMPLDAIEAGEVGGDALRFADECVEDMRRMASDASYLAMRCSKLRERASFARDLVAIRSLPERPQGVRKAPAPSRPRHVRRARRATVASGASPPRLGDDDRPRLAVLRAHGREASAKVCQCGLAHIYLIGGRVYRDAHLDPEVGCCIVCGHEPRVPQELAQRRKARAAKPLARDAVRGTIKTCVGCGHPFIAARRDKKTCSPTCRKAHQRKMRQQNVACDTPNVESPG
jgi:hypothetical protein